MTRREAGHSRRRARSSAATCGHHRLPIAMMLLAALLTGCDSSDRSSLGGSGTRKASVATVEAPAPLAEQSNFPGSPATSRSLIRTAQLDMIVHDVAPALAQAESIAVRLGGFVASSGIERREGVPYGNAVLRVPADRLDRAVAELRRLALRVDTENRGTEDVTTQVVDLDARLRTLRATEVELLELLRESRTRGHKLEDVMAVYRQLIEIRTQIEQLEGQRKMLAELIALSTITLHMTPDAAGRVQIGAWRPIDTLRASAKLLLARLKGLGDFLIFAVVVLLPLGIVIAGLIALLWRLLRFLIERLRGRRKPPV